MGDANVGAVSVRTRFDRFPATVKGAFVVRGEDRDPHQVEVRVGGVKARVARVECTTESATVRCAAKPPGPVSVRLLADGRELVKLEEAFDQATGRGSVTTYPVTRSARSLGVEVRATPGTR